MYRDYNFFFQINHCFPYIIGTRKVGPTFLVYFVSQKIFGV